MTAAMTAEATLPAISKEQLKAFLEKAKDDLNLQERLKAAKSQDKAASITKEHGHNFGTEHISQLSEEELDGVTGGALFCQNHNIKRGCTMAFN